MCQYIHVLFFYHFNTMNLEYSKQFCTFVSDIIDDRQIGIDKRLQTNLKYCTFECVNGIFNIIRNMSYWSRCKSNDFVTYKINGKYLNQIHHKFIQLGHYEHILKTITDMYFMTNKSIKLLDQMSDTTFIKNKLGSEMVDRNKYYKNKNGIKISNCVDIKGVQTALSFALGSECDSVIFKDTINNMIINHEIKK